MFAVVPLLVLGYLGWYYYGADHIDLALYSLRKENLNASRQPDWIQAKVVDEVFTKGALDQLSLLEPNATATIAQAFEAHNWVKSTTRVTKSSGGKVEVDLIYRKPAAMVYYAPQDRPDRQSQANGSTESVGLQRGFYPVDSEGIILPTEDFGRDDIWKYFQVFAEGARPAGDIGMSFGDSRISEALSLCKYLQDVRDELQLQEIWVHRDPQSVGPSPWIMTVVSRDKHRILWGHAPDLEPVGEHKAEYKQARLSAWLASARMSGSPQQIDLRTQMVTSPAAVSQPSTDLPKR